MPKFKMLRGGHTEGANKSGEPVIYEPGDIIDSPTDLCRFNRPGSTKFERVGDGEAATNRGAAKPAKKSTTKS